MKKGNRTHPSNFPGSDPDQHPIFNSIPIGYNLLDSRSNFNSRIVQRQIYFPQILFTGRKDK